MWKKKWRGVDDWFFFIRRWVDFGAQLKRRCIVGAELSGAQLGGAELINNRADLPYTKKKNIIEASLVDGMHQMTPNLLSMEGAVTFGRESQLAYIHTLHSMCHKKACIHGQQWIEGNHTAPLKLAYRR